MNKLIKSLLFLLFTSSIAIPAFSQEDYKELNAKSLKCYNNAEWDSVIYYGKIAEKNDIDYYYLSYRLAVANFYTTNYFTATHYFDKAIKQNESAMSDLVFIDLYYRALLYTKQYCLVDDIFTNTDSIDQVLNIKHRGSFFVTYNNGNIPKPIDVEKLRMDEGGTYMQANYQQTINTISLGGHFNASGIIELDYSYSYSSIGMVAASENTYFFNLKNYNLYQHVVNIKPRFHFTPKSSLDFAFGFHKVNGQPYGILDSTLEMGNYNYNSTNLMLGFNYNYRYKNIVMGANAVYSNFLDTKNLQFGTHLTWFPKGNMNLYSITELSVFKDRENRARPIIYQKIGGRILSKIWLEGYVFLGNVQNFTQINNNYSFEISYKTRAILGGKFIYVHNNKLNLYFGPQLYISTTPKYQDAISENKNGNNNNSNNSDNTIINYSQFNIAGGIQWKF